MHDLWILAESGDFRSQPLLSRVLSISETADQLFDPVIIIVFVLWSLYTKRYQRGSKELVNLVKANLIGLGLSAFVITVWQIQNFPRSLYLLFYLFNFIFGLLSRYIIRRILKTNRKKGRNIKHTVFIGFSTSAAAYIDRIKIKSSMGFKGSWDF